MSKRNAYPEILRCIFCIMIVIHHAGLLGESGARLLPSAGVIADAFFMMSGYFACRHILNHKDDIEEPFRYSLKYTLSKIRKVLPYTTFGILIVYFLDFIHLKSYSLNSLADMACNMAVELLLLPMTGIMKTDLINYRNAPLWYLSAMMIALPFVMFLAIRLKKTFSLCLVFVLPILNQIYMIKTFGGALPWMDNLGLFCSGVPRGFSSLCMGFGVCYLATLFQDKQSLHGKNARIMLTILEILLLISIVVFARIGVHGFGELGVIYLIWLMLIITFSGLSYTTEIRIKNISAISMLTLPVYCIHWGIYRYVATYLGFLPLAVGIILTLVLCIVTAYILVKVWGYIVGSGLYKKRQAG